MSFRNPREWVVPILGRVDDSGELRFLGTGSFMADGGLLITAFHVVEHCKGSIYIAPGQYGGSTFPAVLERADRSLDLAALRVKGLAPADVIKIDLSKDFHTNVPVLAQEYSTTNVRSGIIEFEPACRMGHITRMRDLTGMYSRAGDGMLELSFPALKGASGAPVFWNLPGFPLAGIILANVSHHLVPAQIEEVLDEQNNLYESVKYLLPQALAINCRHVEQFLRTSGYL